jgi:hypothetical protein
VVNKNLDTGVSAQTEAKLAEYLATFYDDPYGFVMAVFPWGEPTLPNGSPNPLRKKRGPELWQEELLRDLGRHIKENRVLASIGCDMKVWRSATASGHGVGKSALVAWILYFLMSTRVDTRGVVTASTQFQLEDKTWPELSKWHNLALNQHWFRWTATTFSFAGYEEESKQKNYRIAAASVSEQNTEAFQGLHNEGKTVVVIFDEASGVKPKVWEVAEGALTDGEAFFFAFGNPTQPTGEFADCFEKHNDLYKVRHVDSRDVTHTNKSALEDTIKKYGVDSDEVKVRIRGLFPSISFNGFINVSGVNDAIERELEPDHGAALVMAIDVARFGNDRTIFGWRQGRDARSFPFYEFRGKTTTEITALAAKEITRTKPDVIVIESTGPGAGVIDQLRDLGHRVHEVHPGSAAVNFEHYANKRAEYWAAMRDAIYDELCLTNDKELFAELTTANYTLDRSGQKYQMESKEDIKKRGLPSPDKADTLALTFAVKPGRRDRNNSRNAGMDRNQSVIDYDPIDY